MFTTVRIFYRATNDRPLCIHSATTAIICAFPVPPLSNLWATDLHGDLCTTVLNTLKTWRRQWRPWRCLNLLCTTIERPRQPFDPLSAFIGDLDSFVVTQRRHKGRSHCVKGVLPHKPMGVIWIPLSVAMSDEDYCTLANVIRKGASLRSRWKLCSRSVANSLTSIFSYHGPTVITMTS